MRSEIEKLINRWRGADNTTDHVLSELQAILDADPVARLEAMGAAIIVDVMGDDLWWSYKGGGDENSELIGSIRITQQEITDAATRLLARIEKEGE